MQAPEFFQLTKARARIEQALEKAGFDVIDDPAEPNLIRGRRDRGTDSTTVIVDGGGRMRFTRTRQLGPEQAETRTTTSHRTFQVAREQSETATVSYQLSPADAKNFAALLAELDQV